METKTFNYIDLFAGIGGMRLAFENAYQEQHKEKEKAKCILTSEIKPYALITYNSIFNETNKVLNIKNVDENKFLNENNKIDFVLGGFPCQPFSYAGKGLGFTDTRGTMFYEICRFLKGKDGKYKPKGFVLENVEGLLTHDNGRTFNAIISELENLNYNVSYVVLDSYDFGLPQTRKRIFICGSLYEKPNLNVIPKMKHKTFKDIREYNLPIINNNFTKRIEDYCLGDFDLIKGKKIRDKRAGQDNIHSWELNLRGKTSFIGRSIMTFVLEERRKKSFAKKYNIEWKDGMPIPKKYILTHFLEMSICTKEDIEEAIDNLLNNGYLKKCYGIEENEIYNSKKDDFYKIPTGNLSFPFVSFQDDNSPLNTIVATDISHLGIIEKNGIRHISTKELLQAFGYPIDFEKHFNFISKTNQFDLFGNTVCVPVVSYCVKQVLETFKNEF